MKLTKNFSKAEFDSKDGACMPNDVLQNVANLAPHIQVIRDAVGKSIVINSGYRSPAHNKAVKGEKNSYHLQGKAGDLRTPEGMTTKQFHTLILKLIADGRIYNGGVGLYDGFVHYDIGAKGRRWNKSTLWK